MKNILYLVIVISIFSCKKTTSNNDLTTIPYLNTDVTNITKNSAKFGSWINSEGGLPITSKGFCYSTSPNPSTSSTIIAGSITSGDMFATPTTLSPNTTYYVKAYATNSKGTGYGEEEVFTTKPPFTIGELYGGGIVFYIDASGLHGLIRRTLPISSTGWGCRGTDIIGTSTAIGSGQANTTAIINSCSTPGIAAKVCNDLVLNGYDDWFLPSRDELFALCSSFAPWGGGAYSLSSSQYTNDFAYGVHFDPNCGSAILYKDDPGYEVYPIRKF